jgi:hypothetical protein
MRLVLLTQNLAGPGIEPGSPHLYRGALLLGHPARSCPERGFHIPTARLSLCDPLWAKAV